MMKAYRLRTALPLALLAPLSAWGQTATNSINNTLRTVTLDNPFAPNSANSTTNQVYSTAIVDNQNSTTGAWSVIKTGIGSFALTSSSSNYSGGIEIRGGALRIGQSTPVSAWGTGNITVGGYGANATLELGSNGTGYVLNNNITLGSGAGTLILGAQGQGAFTFNGTISGSNNVTLASAAAGSATLTFAKQINNAGWVTSRADLSSSFGGSANLSTSTKVAITGGLGANVVGVVQENVGSSATLTISTGNIFVGSSGFTLKNSGGAPISVTAGVDGSGNLSLQNNTTNDTSGISITGTTNHSGAVINSGSGSGRASIGAVGGNVTQIIQNSAVSSLNTTGVITVASGINKLIQNNGGAALNITGGVSGTGDLTVQNNSSNDSTGLVISAGNVVNAGKFINSGNSTSATRVSSLIGQAVTEIQQNSATSALIITGNVNTSSANKTFTNNGGAALTINSAQVGNSGTSFTFRNNSSTNGGISVSGGNISLGNISNLGNGTGSVVIGSVITGNISIIQNSGTSALVLSGTNLFTGATSVTAGVLELSGSGSINGTSGLTVASGATFKNTSSVAFTGALNVTEGALFAGSTGSFAPSSLTINGDLSGGFSALDFAGVFTKPSSLTLNLANITDGSFNLISSQTSGSFSSVSIASTTLSAANGFTATVSGLTYSFDNSLNTLNISSIPEPAAATLLIGFGTLATAFARRQRRG
ncbi:autotransporter-associated beta strand repeat-containing protein [Novosphingobium sp.]|uniref:beta strand repeat-containing protein n=1 Tax=Novosphingobium sp. TaxID=1874826 RepID=UPI0026357D5F|nr:autotransporter-associated beta strand repeat-containing protein [Novosphingobium sp.]